MRGRSGMPDNEYGDGMLEHDGQVGKLLKALDDLNLANETIVIYTTDNGPHMNSWPDAAMTPFRNEKNSNWEGAFRVPTLVLARPASRRDRSRTLDWFPTLLAAAGDTGVKDLLRTGWETGGSTFKVHLDGYNQLPYLTGVQDKSARREFFYFNDDGKMVALRVDNWKVVFCEQRSEGTLKVWREPFVCMRAPTMFNLRMDPYERAEITSNTYDDWVLRRSFLVVPAQAIVARFVATFKEFPPRQRPSSFSVDQVMDQLNKPTGG
jgi:arylsulfatase A-like enzyme